MSAHETTTRNLETALNVLLWTMNEGGTGHLPGCQGEQSKDNHPSDEDWDYTDCYTECADARNLLVEVGAEGWVHTS